MGKPSQAFIDFHVKTVQARAYLSEMKQHLASWRVNEAAIIRLALTEKLKNEEADQMETVALASAHISRSQLRALVARHLARLATFYGQIIEAAIDMRCARKQQFLEAAERAEKHASVAREPMVKETMLALAQLYRDLAIQIDELEWLRRDLIVDSSQ